MTENKISTGKMMKLLSPTLQKLGRLAATDVATFAVGREDLKKRVSLLPKLHLTKHSHLKHNWFKFPPH